MLAGVMYVWGLVGVVLYDWYLNHHHQDQAVALYWKSVAERHLELGYRESKKATVNDSLDSYGR